MIYPPFAEWDGRWGRISIKKAGTTENGSVYCHATMFKAYSDGIMKDGQSLYETLKKTLALMTEITRWPCVPVIITAS